jgi:ABC-2 type transport system permease protein
MKILSIAKMIILRNLREINIMLIMCAMPILLMFILGSAFEGMMNGQDDISIGEINIAYQTDDKDGDLTTGFVDIFDSIGNFSTSVTKANTLDNSLEKLAYHEVDCVVDISELKKEITVYKNDNENRQASLVEGILSTYVDRYNVIIKIVEQNPMALSSLDLDKADYRHVEKIGLDQKYAPSAMDYYTVLMTILFTLYGLLTPALDKLACKKRGLITRIKTTPVSSAELFSGEILGYFGISMIRVLIVFSATILFFGADWGLTPIYPLLMLSALTLMVVAIGVFIADSVKSEGAASSLCQIFIIASAFFGGAYVSFETMGPGIADIGKYFSAIWWANKGIMELIYTGEYSSMIIGSVIFVIVTALFLSMTITVQKIKEAR